MSRSRSAVGLTVSPTASLTVSLNLALTLAVAAALLGCRPEAAPARSPFDDRRPAPTAAPNVPNFPPPFAPPTLTPSPTASPSPAAGGPTSTPRAGSLEAEAAAAAAIDTLASRMGVPAARFALERVDAVQWSDACLGVAVPGVFCAQVITPGYRVVLRANTGSLHEVRTGRGGAAAWSPQTVHRASVREGGAALTLEVAGGAVVRALVGGGTQLLEVTPGALRPGDRVVLGADDLGDGSPLRVAWLARDR